MLLLAEIRCGGDRGSRSPAASCGVLVAGVAVSQEHARRAEDRQAGRAAGAGPASWNGEFDGRMRASAELRAAEQERSDQEGLAVEHLEA